MSWWKTEKGNLIGDAPADFLNEALRRLAQASADQGKAKPTLAELLGAIASIIQIDPDEFLSEDGGARFTVLTAIVDRAPGRLSVSPESTINKNIAAHLRGALRSIAQEYEQNCQRKPTLQELLDVLAFVLRYKPEDYLSDAEGLNIQDIVADGR